MVLLLLLLLLLLMLLSMTNYYICSNETWPECRTSECRRSTFTIVLCSVPWCLIWWFAILKEIWSYMTRNIFHKTIKQQKLNQMKPNVYVLSVDLLQASVCPNTIWFFVSWHLGNLYLARGQIQLWYHRYSEREIFYWWKTIVKTFWKKQ